MKYIFIVLSTLAILTGCTSDTSTTYEPSTIDKVWWETQSDPQTGVVLRCLWGKEKVDRGVGLAVWCYEI